MIKSNGQYKPNKLFLTKLLLVMMFHPSNSDPKIVSAKMDLLLQAKSSLSWLIQRQGQGQESMLGDQERIPSYSLDLGCHTPQWDGVSLSAFVRHLAHVALFKQ